MSKNKDQAARFPEKWLKKLPTGWAEEAEAMSTEDLKKAIVSSEGNIYSIEKEKEADTKLNSAKELVKEYSGGYRDAINCQSAKIKYALHLLEGKGVDLDSQDKD